MSSIRRNVRVYRARGFFEDMTGLSVVFGIIAFCAALIAAWITHVVWIIGRLASSEGATVGQMVLGVLGAFMPPVGVIHGLMIWFGTGM